MQEMINAKVVPNHKTFVVLPPHPHPLFANRPPKLLFTPCATLQRPPLPERGCAGLRAPALMFSALTFSAARWFGLAPPYSHSPPFPPSCVGCHAATPLASPLKCRGGGQWPRCKREQLPRSCTGGSRSTSAHCVQPTRLTRVLNPHCVQRGGVACLQACCVLY